MKWIRWFIAGALAVPLGHQIVFAILNAIGWIDRKPWSFEPTEPFGVPQLLSLSFWGGVWGIILGLVLLRVRSPRAWWAIAIVFGATATTLVAGLVVMPLKGMSGGVNPRLAVVGLAVNGAWAFVTALLYRLFERWAATSRSSPG